jgi:hypothetical protein
MTDKPSVTDQPLAMILADRYEAATEYVTVHNFAVLAGHTWHKGKCTCAKPTCDRPAKHPLTKNGVKDATKDIETVTKWWTQLRGMSPYDAAIDWCQRLDIPLPTLPTTPRNREEEPVAPKPNIVIMPYASD